ncbi:MAG: hypothetical protein KDA87_00775 [Planctomycetales bacterium]|nr:hypothetical protein [Planctomycetales bacterium]
MNDKRYPGAELSPMRSNCLWFAILLLVCVGCTPMQLAYRTMYGELHGYPRVTDGRLANQQYKRWAKQEWNQLATQSGGTYSSDYGSGFIQGFVDQVYAGGEADPPPVPPRRFWRVGYRNVRGTQAVEDWYNGFSHGAKVARDGGYRQRAVIPSSMLLGYNAEEVPEWEVDQTAPNQDWPELSSPMEEPMQPSIVGPELTPQETTPTPALEPAPDDPNDQSDLEIPGDDVEDEPVLLEDESSETPDEQLLNDSLTEDPLLEGDTPQPGLNDSDNSSDLMDELPLPDSNDDLQLEDGLPELEELEGSGQLNDLLQETNDLLEDDLSDDLLDPVSFETDDRSPPLPPWQNKPATKQTKPVTPQVQAFDPFAGAAVQVGPSGSQLKTNPIRNTETENGNTLQKSVGPVVLESIPDESDTDTTNNNWQAR